MFLSLRFFGICFITLLVGAHCAFALAQERSINGRGRASSPPLFSAVNAHFSTHPTVQKDLNLTEEQKAKAKAPNQKMKVANDKQTLVFCEALSRIKGQEKMEEFKNTIKTNLDMKHILLLQSLSLSSVRLLSSLWQEALEEELFVHPSLLKPISHKAIFRVYQICRIGDPDSALRLLGQWAQMHPETEARFSSDMYKQNCMNYCVIAYSIAKQYPLHLSLLERDYLVFPDGECCLPVAYILAAGYSIQGHREEWIEKLCMQLKDGRVKDDCRIGWLLARAWTEEISFAEVMGHEIPKPNFIAGHGWLEEACLVAKSEPVRLRAYKELATRFACEEQFDTAKKILTMAKSRRCSSLASIKSLAVWQQELDQIAQSNRESQKGVEIAAEQAYWNEMQIRYHKAVDAGDQEESLRYEQAFNNAGIKP